MVRYGWLEVRAMVYWAMYGGVERPFSIYVGKKSWDRCVSLVGGENLTLARRAREA